MSKHRRKDVFTGLVIVLVGVLFLLQNLGYIHGSIWRYWPVILIIFGISELL
jgi:lia operon protein LiaF